MYNVKLKPMVQSQAFKNINKQRKYTVIININMLEQNPFVSLHLTESKAYYGN